MVQRVVVGACLTAHDRLGVFTFSLKALLALRKLKRIKEGKKKKPHFLCSSLTTQK